MIIPSTPRAHRLRTATVLLGRVLVSRGRQQDQTAAAAQSFPSSPIRRAKKALADFRHNQSDSVGASQLQAARRMIDYITVAANVVLDDLLGGLANSILGGLTVGDPASRW